MDTSTILTIVGVFITLPGIFLTWKTIFRPKLQLISEDITEIANVGKVSNDLIIKYRGEEVSNDLLLISAYLINGGNADIGINDVELPVTLCLPKDSLWLSFVVTKNNHDMKIEGKCENSKLVINTGLWKKGEGIKFDALICISDRDMLNDKNKIFDLVDIKSRIKGVGKIKVKKFPEVTVYQNNFEKYLRLFFPTLVMFAYVVLGVLTYTGYLKEERFELEVYDDKNELILTNHTDKGAVLITKDRIQLDAKNGFYNVNVKFSNTNIKDKNQKAGIFIIVLGVFGMILFNVKKIINYRLRKKVLKS